MATIVWNVAENKPTITEKVISSDKFILNIKNENTNDEYECVINKNDYITENIKEWNLHGYTLLYEYLNAGVNYTTYNGALCMTEISFINNELNNELNVELNLNVTNRGRITYLNKKEKLIFKLQKINKLVQLITPTISDIEWDGYS